MKTILAVDDEKNYLLVISTLLKEDGYEVITTQNPYRAVEILDETPLHLIITDMKMPGLSGIDILKAVKEKRPEIPVIVLTAFGTVETAVDAMRLGAYHYILKPFQNQEIKLVVNRAFKMVDLVEEKNLLNQELSARFGIKGFVAESGAMKNILSLVEQVAPARTTVLIHGESGTGKELIARAIHQKSSRAERPFIAVNCGALTETLLESELFGHEKGAFTGATMQKKGRFELADGGTLFLDEIGTTSPALQIRLLRVLQEQVFERVGGTRSIKVDVRIIAASNIDLKELIEKGGFREDLYYRLNVFTITIPPLRERKEDIIPLANYFLNIYSKEIGKQINSISRETIDPLINYQWPGNVRELKNVIERAVVVCRGHEIGCGELPMEIRHGSVKQMLSRTIDLTKPLPAAVEEFEMEIIKEALKRTGGVQAKAARLLGISPTNLQYKVNKYDLPEKAN
ncbi:MAG: sigma-54-dependent Fis family transcriptional regulator [Deltaproteobacteria bacterium]|nr:sigma-54-dependent Fis family transcriptional regulator [Deltaproteobacteria bacterium]